MCEDGSDKHRTLGGDREQDRGFPPQLKAGFICTLVTAAMQHSFLSEQGYRQALQGFLMSADVFLKSDLTNLLITLVKIKG